MKRTSSLTRSSRSQGFTLVELLVVMGIIAILAGVLFAAGGAAIRSAKRAKAMNTATQINTGVLNYYTEYSIYPVPSGQAASADFLISDTDAADWKGVLYGLCGNINPFDATTTAPGTAVPNTRGIAFLNLKKSDVDTNGGPLNPLPTGTKLYFNLAIDNDYDNIVGDSGTASGKLPDFANSTITSITFLTKGTTGGTAVWVDCNGTGTNPNFYQKTY